MNKVVFNHTCKNESNRYIVVGNCAEFISDHETLEQACSALSKIPVGESKWARIDVLDPGETKSCNGLERTLYEKQDIPDGFFDLD